MLSSFGKDLVERRQCGRRLRLQNGGLRQGRPATLHGMEIEQHAIDADHRHAHQNVVLLGEIQAGIDHHAGGGGH